MKHFEIEYDTEYGTANFAGEYESFSAFIAEADKAGREAGVLGVDESVLDCDYDLLDDHDLEALFPVVKCVIED